MSDTGTTFVPPESDGSVPSVSSTTPASPLRQEQRSGIAIRRATRVPAEWLERFYERMFPARAAFLARHWRWLYRIDKERPDWSSLVAVNRHEVVGHLGLIPVTLCRRSEEYPAVWFVDLAVLPEYQGIDIGTGLARAAMPLCQVQLGFGNPRSMSLLAGCGWTVTSDTAALRLFLRPESHPSWRSGRRKTLASAVGSMTRIVSRARTLSPRELAVFPAVHVGDFRRRRLGGALQVDRSRDFLRWRIDEHPASSEYVVLEQRNRGSGGCRALARVVEGSCRRLHLLSLEGQVGWESLSPFLASVVRWALDGDIHQILFITSDIDVARMARWWLPSVKRLSFASHANDARSQAFLDRGDQLWECLDSDFDLMYVGQH